MLQAGKPIAAAPYRRPAGPQSYGDRAARDWELLGQVERVSARPPEILEAMVRCEPEKYTKFMGYLGDLVDRHIDIVDAATEAHAAIAAALNG